MKSTLRIFIAVIGSLLLSCSSEKPQTSKNISWDLVQDSTQRLVSIGGFSGPEAVRYDPEQDVYFVSNFNGGGSDRDSNGFISKVNPNGSMDSLRFMTGTKTAPLHAPRGMFITGHTLWAADVDGVHGFDTQTGKQSAFVDFTHFEPGFLNDIVEGPSGNLYVTDTGKATLYNIQNGTPSIVRDSLSAAPNGVAFHADSKTLVLAPWGGDLNFLQWNPGDSSAGTFLKATSGGYYDGIEFVNGKLLAASQQDSSLHLIGPDSDKIVIHVPGRPADIGLDTKRMQVAVPYIALNNVDIWQLPQK